MLDAVLSTVCPSCHLVLITVFVDSLSRHEDEKKEGFEEVQTKRIKMTQASLSRASALPYDSCLQSEMLEVAPVWGQKLTLLARLRTAW